MSTTNSDLINLFPDSIDPNFLYYEMTATDKTYVDQFYTYMASGDFTSANALFTSYPRLTGLIITSHRMQYHNDEILSLERFYFSDFQKYITTAVKFKGAYSSTVAYEMLNVATYNYKAYMCMSSSCPINTLPTNSTYWVALTLEGISGTGMSFYPSYSTSQAYKLQDCVPYGGILYVCIQAHTNQNPSTATTYWSPVITAPKQIVTSASQPSGQNTDELWYEILA